ncbi:hypothetical protein [Novosphingobium ginsenosidimutans]|uniref:DUF5681 domain-containing protein n=1 Tax=Novosphingobium ginsenosidimutans TaxID=1176536 RepID=A0A5B8S3C9_9SPHN|nr:hypothetical protein [Novosphingobium ginsenosidimutans]QEA15628.1 hypothetical protein FRF71_05475 [Novosphingobium ginsenosidimutans]
MANDPDDIDPELVGQPAGYGKPPYEHRWPKGYCPNPTGRPRKKQTMAHSAPLNEFQQRMLKEARKVITEIDGTPFTNLDKLLLELRTSNRPEDRKLLLKFCEEALKADHEWRSNAVKDLIAYKEYWGPIFMRRRMLGQKLPEVYPDPNDIKIISATEFRFIGPVTAEEAALWNYIDKQRSAFFMVADELIEAAGLYNPLERDFQRYLKVRRQFYRFNRRLPADFKKKHPAKFPAFKPPAEPPEWYRGDDEWADPESGE